MYESTSGIARSEGYSHCEHHHHVAVYSPTVEEKAARQR
jgi:hypothetical protein